MTLWIILAFVVGLLLGFAAGCFFAMLGVYENMKHGKITYHRDNDKALSK